MNSLTMKHKQEIRLNLIISAGLLVLYAATYLLSGGRIPPFHLFECGGTLLLLTLVLYRIPPLYYLSVLAFAFVAQYGGVMFRLYEVIPIYDLLLHLASGVLLTFMGHYFLLLLLRRHRECVLPLAVTFLFCWLFALACANLWEIYEFSVDQLFGLDSQMWTTGFGGLVDTMTDIIMGTLGATLGLLPLYLLVRSGAGRVRRL